MPKGAHNPAGLQHEHLNNYIGNLVSSTLSTPSLGLQPLLQSMLRSPFLSLVLGPAFESATMGADALNLPGLGSMSGLFSLDWSQLPAFMSMSFVQVIGTDKGQGTPLVTVTILEISLWPSANAEKDSLYFLPETWTHKSPLLISLTSQTLTVQKGRLKNVGRAGQVCRQLTISPGSQLLKKIIYKLPSMDDLDPFNFVKIH